MRKTNCRKIKETNTNYEKAKEIAFKFICESQPFCFIHSLDEKTFTVAPFMEKVPSESVYVEFIHKLIPH